MSQNDEEQKILQQLQEFIKTITLRQPWNYEANNEGVLNSIEALAEYMGKGVNKGLLKKLRKILKSDKIEDKRKFIISSIPSEAPNAETIKRAFKQATDMQVHTAFYFYAMTELGKPSLKERKKQRERQQLQELKELGRRIKEAKTRDEIFKEWEETNAVRAKAFSSHMGEYAESLEAKPDNIG
ncbi:unnamed protein product, partial [marine sediment metagenome]